MILERGKKLVKIKNNFHKLNCPIVSVKLIQPSKFNQCNFP